MAMDLHMRVASVVSASSVCPMQHLTTYQLPVNVDHLPADGASLQSTTAYKVACSQSALTSLHLAQKAAYAVQAQSRTDDSGT